jgi:hypothetical protein
LGFLERRGRTLRELDHADDDGAIGDILHRLAAGLEQTHNIYGRTTRADSYERILELLFEAKGVKMPGPYPWASKATP